VSPARQGRSRRQAQPVRPHLGENQDPEHVGRYFLEDPGQPAALRAQRLEGGSRAADEVTELVAQHAERRNPAEVRRRRVERHAGPQEPGRQRGGQAVQQRPVRVGEVIGLLERGVRHPLVFGQEVRDVLGVEVPLARHEEQVRGGERRDVAQPQVRVQVPEVVADRCHVRGGRGHDVLAGLVASAAEGGRQPRSLLAGPGGDVARDHGDLLGDAEKAGQRLRPVAVAHRLRPQQQRPAVSFRGQELREPAHDGRDRVRVGEPGRGGSVAVLGDGPLGLDGAFQRGQLAAELLAERRRALRQVQVGDRVAVRGRPEGAPPALVGTGPAEIERVVEAISGHCCLRHFPSPPPQA
jgi:hypothetical protein